MVQYDTHYRNAVSVQDIIIQASRSRLSTLRQVVYTLQKSLLNRDQSAGKLKDLIEKDPALTATLMKEANSAFYGYKNKIDDIKKAIILVGFDRVRQMALRQKMFDFFSKLSSSNKNIIYGLWNHSILVATCAKSIYRKEFGLPGDDIYLAGLLHDFGQIAEFQFMQADFIQIISQTKLVNIDIDKLEKRKFGFDHAFLGKSIAKAWNFPDVIAESIGGHCNPMAVRDQYRKLTMVLFIADYICTELYPVFSKPGYVQKKILVSCLNSLRIKQEAMELFVEELKAEYANLEENNWLLKP